MTQVVEEAVEVHRTMPTEYSVTIPTIFQPQELQIRASVRALSPHIEVRVEKLQRDIPDILVQLGPIHARGIIAGFGIVIPPYLIALIVEDLVIDRSASRYPVTASD
jgi:hypothetical protein